MDVVLHQRSWGSGAPVIALHPLGLDSSGFAGFGRAMARRGLRTIAVDLPGFGRSPRRRAADNPRLLAAPVIALARELEEPPVVMGISLGARVALETALRAPDAVRAVVAVAPALPWLRFRFLLPAVRLLDPDVAAKWLPLEYAWPLLRWLAATLEELPYLRDDEIAQAGARLVYYMSCPATRASFASAAREMVLEPATGAKRFLDALERPGVPALFVWGERDRLVSASFAHRVALTRPDVPQLLLPASPIGSTARTHRCLAEAMAVVVEELRAAKGPAGRCPGRVRIGARSSSSEHASRMARRRSGRPPVPPPGGRMLDDLLDALRSLGSRLDVVDAWSEATERRFARGPSSATSTSCARCSRGWNAWRATSTPRSRVWSTFRNAVPCCWLAIIRAAS